MRLVTFTTPALPAGQCRVGVLAEGRVVDIFAACYARARQRGDSPAEAHHTASAMAPPDMVAFFAAGDLGRRTAGSAVAFAIDALRAGDDIAGPAGEAAAPLEGDVRLPAPAPRPRRVRDTRRTRPTPLGRDWHCRKRSPGCQSAISAML